MRPDIPEMTYYIGSAVRRLCGGIQHAPLELRAHDLKLLEKWFTQLEIEVEEIDILALSHYISADDIWILKWMKFLFRSSEAGRPDSCVG